MENTSTSSGQLGAIFVVNFNHVNYREIVTVCCYRNVKRSNSGVP